MSYKLNVKSNWLLFIIPLLPLLIFGVPEIYNSIEIHYRRIDVLEERTAELEALKELKNPDRITESKIKSLTPQLKWEQRSLHGSTKVFLQTAGLFIVLAGMFLIMAWESSKMKNLKLKNTGWSGSHNFSDPTQDTIAQQIDWSPANSGGSNFVSHEIKQVSSSILKVKKTSTLNLFGGVFFLAGLNYVVLAYYFAYIDGILEEQSTLKNMQLFFREGGVFLLLGVVFLVMFASTATFNKQLNRFKKGKFTISFSEIYAIQLITEFVQSSGGSSGSYLSHELNLVLTNGNRINIMDHGVKAHIEEDAILLGKFLNIPVWNKISIL
ncbi:hypothetical protein [Aquimarina intermedia]|uniref:Uncharacterized protein n=1 Tax=Aquimarina intermedia TaxID=350814 RepID=A0A5S5C988_9FLAO|nr:hypothetical protein [Aquimarina intermedia]TYP74946.1 hypothetical protein BD809_1038 [Aquimarina intermedia]